MRRTVRTTEGPPTLGFLDLAPDPAGLVLEQRIDLRRSRRDHIALLSQSQGCQNRTYAQSLLQAPPSQP